MSYERSNLAGGLSDLKFKAARVLLWRVFLFAFRRSVRRRLSFPTLGFDEDALPSVCRFKISDVLTVRAADK